MPKTNNAALSTISVSRKFEPTQDFNPIKGKPEPQADLHPQIQMEPTPRPWCVMSSVFATNDGAFYIAPCNISELTTFLPIARLDTASSEKDEANAEFIVRAVNSFDDLLEACKEVQGNLYTVQDIGRVRDMVTTALASAERKP